MDETNVTTDEPTVDMPLKHQFGKLMVSSIAGFGASKLAENAYDAILRARRARKSS